MLVFVLLGSNDMSTTTITAAEFTTAVQENKTRYFKLAEKITGNWADAEDAVQLGLIVAWEKRAEFDPTKGTGGLSVWIGACVKLKARMVRVDRYRSRDLLVGGWETEFGFEFKDRPVVSNDLPCIAEEETANRVRKALHRLPARERQVVELHALGGMSITETARTVGISTSTAVHTMSRALARIVADESVQGASSAAPTSSYTKGVDSPEAQAFRARPELLDELTPRQRDVIRLRYFQQMPIADVERRLGISRATVRWTTAFARRRLHAAMPELVSA